MGELLRLEFANGARGLERAAKISAIEDWILCRLDLRVALNSKDLRRILIAETPIRSGAEQQVLRPTKGRAVDLRTAISLLWLSSRPGRIAVLCRLEILKCLNFRDLGWILITGGPIRSGAEQQVLRPTKGRAVGLRAAINLLWLSSRRGRIAVLCRLEIFKRLILWGLRTFLIAGVPIRAFELSAGTLRRRIPVLGMAEA